MLNSMTFDNRYFPLFYKPYIRRPGVHAHARIRPFFMRAERGIGALNHEVNLPDIEGHFDDVRIGQYDQLEVINGLKKTKLLPEDFCARIFNNRDSGLLWKRHGILEAQGVAFFYEHYFGSCWSAGISCFFMQVNSCHEFCLDSDCAPHGFGDRQFLFDLRQKLHKYYLGLEPALFSPLGFSDLDFFVRCGRHWDYVSKFRSIDVGLKLGVIAPSACPIKLNNPASVPLGGNKHWGVYLDLETTLELKEDWYFLLLIRGIKRIENTRKRRLSLRREPGRYGALIDEVTVDPGWTLVINPWLIFEGLREGFGARIGLVTVHHFRDIGLDMRRDKSIRSSVSSTYLRRTQWAYEYISVGAFYDFAKFRDCRRFVPTATLCWDIPVHWRFSKRSNKTHCVSLIVEADF